jgi:hypothetical protein
MPALIAPSPITAMTWFLSPFRSRATAMPSPAEIEVELCAAPNGSYSLSARRVKPDRPPPWRNVRMRSRPGQDLVRIGLMADIPDQPVARRVEDVMEPNGELDDTESGTEMAAGRSAGSCTESSSGVRSLRNTGAASCVFLSAVPVTSPSRRTYMQRLVDYRNLIIALPNKQFHCWKTLPNPACWLSFHAPLCLWSHGQSCV